MKKLYSREVIMFGCHFNGQEAYDKFYKLLEKADEVHDDRLHALTNTFEPVYSLRECMDDILFIMRETHGHNFKVKVEASTSKDNSEFVIYDEDIENYLMETWGPHNYSVLPKLTNKKKRATCEYMAETIASDLLHKHGKPGMTMTVYVYEYDDRYAVSEQSY